MHSRHARWFTSQCSTQNPDKLPFVLTLTVDPKAGVLRFRTTRLSLQGRNSFQVPTGLQESTCPVWRYKRQPGARVTCDSRTLATYRYSFGVSIRHRSLKLHKLYRSRLLPCHNPRGLLPSRSAFPQCRCAGHIEVRREETEPELTLVSEAVPRPRFADDQPRLPLVERRHLLARFGGVDDELEGIKILVPLHQL